jgi:ABC-type glycerol-3-phosphate transport system permease component
MMAGALVSLLPLFIAFMFAQRKFIESLSSSGLK